MAAIKYDADYSESGVTALLHPQQSTARDTADFFPFCGSSFVFSFCTALEPRLEAIAPLCTETASDVPGLETTRLYETLKHVHEARGVWAD